MWHTISWYIEEFHTPLRGHNSIWQIHNAGDWAPMFNTDLAHEGLYWQRRTACNIPKIYKKYNAKGNDGCSTRWKENANVKIMKIVVIFNYRERESKNPLNNISNTISPNISIVPINEERSEKEGKLIS